MIGLEHLKCFFYVDEPAIQELYNQLPENPSTQNVYQRLPFAMAALISAGV